jgi:hypothetical protein
MNKRITLTDIERKAIAKALRKSQFSLASDSSNVILGDYVLDKLIKKVCPEGEDKQ